MSNQDTSSFLRSGGSTRRVLIFGGGILFILLAIAYAFANYNTTSKNPNSSNSSKKTAASTALKNNNGPIIPFSLARSPSFVVPNMKGYYKEKELSVAAEEYNLSDEGSCNIQFGIAAQEDLPGDTLTDVAMFYLSATPNDGATILSQSNGEDLILNDASKNQRYVMQTIDLTYNRDNVDYMAADSIAFLPGNKRAFVRRYCADTGGPTAANFKKVNEKAREILVRTK